MAQLSELCLKYESKSDTDGCAASERLKRSFFPPGHKDHEHAMILLWAC